MFAYDLVFSWMVKILKARILLTMAASARPTERTWGPWRARDRSLDCRDWRSSPRSSSCLSPTPRSGARYRRQSLCSVKSCQILILPADSGLLDLLETRKTSRRSSTALQMLPWTDLRNANFGSQINLRYTISKIFSCSCLMSKINHATSNDSWKTSVSLCSREK